MVKKVMSLILSIILIFCVSIVVSAESPVVTPGTLKQTEYDVMPCYEYINKTMATLNISPSGTATCLASVSGYTGTTTKVVINMTLQKKTLLWWSAEASWSITINDWQGSLNKATNVGSGKYRVKAEYTVYCGSNSEETTSYSQETEY